MTDLQSVDPRAYRNVIGMFATGVTVISSGSGEAVHAMTANAVTSLSLDPTLLIFCVKKEARMSAKIEANQCFSVSILCQEQEALSNFFSGYWPHDEEPNFEFVDWHGSSRLNGCNAAMACELHALHDGGDHWIAVGRVVDLYTNDEGSAPLIYYQGKYRQLEAS